MPLGFPASQARVGVPRARRARLRASGHSREIAPSVCEIIPFFSVAMACANVFGRRIECFIAPPPANGGCFSARVTCMCTGEKIGIRITDKSEALCSQVMFLSEHSGGEKHASRGAKGGTRGATNSQVDRRSFQLLAPSS